MIEEFQKSELKNIFSRAMETEEFQNLVRIKDKLSERINISFKDYLERNEKIENFNEKKKKIENLFNLSFSFIANEKKFFISKIEESYEITKTQRFILNTALSIFGKKTVISYLPKFIKEQESMANFLYENYEEISKLVSSKDKEGLWKLIGKDICDALLEKKSNNVPVPIEVPMDEVIVEEDTAILQEKALDNSKELEEAKKSLEEKFNKKLSELEAKEKNLDKQRDILEERLNALSIVEEKYSNLLKDLENKTSDMADEEKSEPEKILGVSVGGMPIAPMPIVQKEESKIEHIEGFSATESAVIKHMEEVLRHKKGTQNIWVDDETDKEYAFQSTVKISRGVKVISDKKEILEYYKKSRNIEQL